MYEKEIQIVNSIRAAIACVSHHRTFTKRVVDSVRTSLSDYTISGNSEDWMGSRKRHTIRVYGNGIKWDDAITCTWVDGDDASGKDWYEKLSLQLDRCDMSDYEERLKDEVVLHDAFGGMEESVKRLQKEISAIRSAAYANIEKLPIPKAARTRKEPSFWNSPSATLRDMFPHLLNGKDV